MLLDVIAEVQAATGTAVHAYVIMPDHLHIVLTLRPQQRISRVMQLIKRRFANRWNVRVGRTGSVWQSRFHEEALRSEEALNGAIDYVHWNPVDAGMVSSPEEYAWSSAARENASSGRLVRVTWLAD